MHAGAVDGESAFAAQGVIDGEEECAVGTEDAYHKQREAHVEKIDIPGGVADEAMEATPMAVGDVAAGEDDVRDKAMAMGEDPAGTDLHEGAKGRLGENRSERG